MAKQTLALLTRLATFKAAYYRNCALCADNILVQRKYNTAWSKQMSAVKRLKGASYVA